MRISKRAHWAAWRLYSSLSQNAARVRPLASLHQCEPGFLGPQRPQERVKDTSPKNSSSIPLRHFLSCSARSWPVSYVAVPGKIVLSNVFSLASSPLSTERRVEEADGSGQMFGTSGRTEQSQNSESECSPSPPVDTKGVNASGWSKEEVVNWPNAISISRLLSGPLLAWYIFRVFMINHLFYLDNLLTRIVFPHHSFWKTHQSRIRNDFRDIFSRQCKPIST